MTGRLLIAFALMLIANMRASAAEPQKVTVQIRGVVTDDDAAALQETLKGVAAIKVKLADIQRGVEGNFRHHFSPPFAMELSDIDQTDLGAVARAVAGTKTPSREKIPPSLNLVIFDRRAIFDEPDVNLLREALASVAGVDPNAPGAVGGVPSEGRYWVRLDPSGEVLLADLRTALTRASLEFRLEKE